MHIIRKYKPNAWHISTAGFLATMVVINLAWIHINKAPPRMYDDAFYLAESVQLYHLLISGDLDRFWNECSNASRGVHPPMVKILPVPFHYIFGLGARSGLYALTALIPVFGLYIFLIARRLFVSDRVAFLAVAVTCLFPLTYGMWRNLMAEFGTAAAAAAAIYHLIRSEGFQNRLHTVFFAVFAAWGLWWKISFPAFVLPLLIYFVAAGIRSPRYPAVIVNLVLAGFAGAFITFPFYLKDGRGVLHYALFASEGNQVTEFWSLGPPLLPATLMRYWLAIINSGISPFLFVVLVTLVMLNALWRRGTGNRHAWIVLTLWFVPAWLFFSVQVMKEERHLLPAYAAIAVAIAALAERTIDRWKPARGAVGACLLLWPAYQHLSSSFDHPALPRPDIRIGPLKFLVADLQLASLQLLPSYTFPASPVHWPTTDVVRLIASNSSDINGPPRLKVVGDNPFISGLVIHLESVLQRVPLTTHLPFKKGLGINWDFVFDLCGPERVYGPLDEREPLISAMLQTGKLPFRPVGAVRLPGGCNATLYKKSMTAPILMSDLIREYNELGYPVGKSGAHGEIELSAEHTLPLIYIPSSGATLVFEDNGRPHRLDYDLGAIEPDAGDHTLDVQTVRTDAGSGWSMRRARLNPVRGKIVDLKFMLRSDVHRPEPIRFRNVRLENNSISGRL